MHVDYSDSNPTESETHKSKYIQENLNIQITFEYCLIKKFCFSGDEGNQVGEDGSRNEEEAKPGQTVSFSNPLKIMNRT